MMILALHDDDAILGWLCDEPIEAAENHIRNGYPHLLPGWQAGTVRACALDVPAAEAAVELYRATAAGVERIPT